MEKNLKETDLFTLEVQKQSSKSIFDARNLNNHPAALTYSEIYESVLLKAPIKYGRTQPGWPLDNSAPFVLAADKGKKEKKGQQRFDAIYAVLHEFYNTFQPSNAFEYLGLKTDSNHPLVFVPPWGSVFPWRARSQASYQGMYEKAALEENRKIGVEQGIQAGWLFCGPVSDVKCKIESKRIEYVLDQIEKFEYCRDNSKDGDVKATGLVDEANNWRWIITAGNHRASVAAALGYINIPVRINLVIRRSEVKNWPHVIDGLYDRNKALQVFDRFFNSIKKSAEN